MSNTGGPGPASGDIAIAICDRCRMQRRYKDLKPDGNSPGLRVCGQGCFDTLDPYRLPPRQEEPLAMQFPRPDAPLDVTDDGLALQGENEIYVLLEDGTILGLT